jgi:hypothetical protein
VKVAPVAVTRRVAKAVTRAAGTPVEDIPAAVVDVAKGAQVVGAVDAVKEAVPADQAVVRVDHAAASASISAKRKSASSVSRKWT